MVELDLSIILIANYPLRSNEVAIMNKAPAAPVVAKTSLDVNDPPEISLD